MPNRIDALLDQIDQGLLCAGRDGAVRRANAEAACATGLSAGMRLPDDALLQAVADTVIHRVPRSAVLSGLPATPNGPTPQIHCRVLPGLGEDEAFVLLGERSDRPQLEPETLLRLMHDDLLRPLARVQQALAAAGQVPDGPAVAVLADELVELLGALEQLVALGGLWQRRLPPQHERVELVALLHQAWAEVEPVARGRGVQVRFRVPAGSAGQAAVYGRADWLRRVLQECLLAALRATAPHGQLRVELRQNGSLAGLVFRDTAMFSAEAAPGGPAGAPQALSWQLCRRILALHGGQMHAEDGSGVRNFMVELPTGAPFQPENGGLDAAQAQQYARDLAALMARARRQAGADRPVPAAAMG